MSWCVLGPVRSHISAMSNDMAAQDAARTASTADADWELRSLVRY